MDDQSKILIVVFLLILGICGGGMFLAMRALDNNEQYECVTWKSEAKTFPNYYITKWQKEQCDHWNISIDAPVQ